MGNKIIELKDTVFTSDFEVYDRILVRDDLVINLSEKEYEIYYGKEIYRNTIRENLLKMFYKAARGKDNSYLTFDVGTVPDSKRIERQVKAIRLLNQDECLQGIFIPTNQYRLLIEKIDDSINKILFEMPEKSITNYFLK